MWITPKTNWKSSDYFNAIDYNRIKNNLLYLKSVAERLYKECPYEDAGADKTVFDYFYADEINKIESNLERINQHTLRVNYGEKPTYMDNQRTMTYSELNRLETATADLLDKLNNQYDGRRNLAFNFGKRGDL